MLWLGLFCIQKEGNVKRRPKEGSKRRKRGRRKKVMLTFVSYRAASLCLSKRKLATWWVRREMRKFVE